MARFTIIDSKFELTDAELAAIAAQVKALLDKDAPRLLWRCDFNNEALEPIKAANTWDKGAWQDLVYWSTLGPTLGRVRLLSLTDPLPPFSGAIAHEIVKGRLISTIFKSSNGYGPMGAAPTQAGINFLPKADVPTCYVKAKIELQPDLIDKMAAMFPVSGWAWRQLLLTKTGGQLKDSPANDGDQRVQIAIKMMPDRVPFWQLVIDNNAGSTATPAVITSLENRNVPVPQGPFEIEWCWTRGDKGRVAFAVNGDMVFDWRGTLTSAMPINRIFAPILYTGAALPAWQAVDNLEVWSAPPATASII